MRNFARHPRIADWLRITIGTKEDMDRVVVAIIKIMERQRPAMI